MEGHARAEARRDTLPPRPDPDRAQRAVRARHDARDGQGPERDPRRRAGSDRYDLLLRGRRATAAWLHYAFGVARQDGHVRASAHRRLRADHAVEFSDGHTLLED